MHYSTFKVRLAAVLAMAFVLSAPAFSQSESSSKQKNTVSTKATVSSSDKIYTATEKMPVFPGGPAALKKYLEENVAYPQSARGEQGCVIVSFVVEKDGTVSNAKVWRSVHPDLDAEALRVVESMPKWRPGLHNGEVVRVKYNVPVTFLRPDNL